MRINQILSRARIVSLVLAFASMFVFLPLKSLASYIDVDPASWDFGEILIGDSASKEFVVSNADPDIGDVITVYYVEIWDDPFSAFALDLHGISLPIDLEFPSTTPTAPEFIAFDVIFTPPGAYLYNATLAVEGTHAGAPWRIPIQGRGVSVPEPATIFLFGSGLVGLVGLRRKFKKR